MSKAAVDSSAAESHGDLWVRRLQLLRQPLEADSRHHLVQFYESERFLAETVALFAKTGLENGEAVILVAERDHFDLFEQRLRRHGIRARAARQSGQFTMLEASETLQKFMVDGMPDRERFEKVIGGLIENVSRRYPRTRAYGEMVNVLWKSGNLDATLALENLWCDLARTHAFTLLCGYSLPAFNQPSHVRAFESVCHTHSHVFPSERAAADSRTLDANLRTIALLEQRARAMTATLDSEREARTDAEEQKKKVEQALQVRDEFLSVASHELRTPLTSLKLQLQLAQRRTSAEATPAPHNLQRTLSTALTQVDRLSGLIDQLLDVSKIEGGKLALESSEVDLLSVVRPLLEQFHDEFTAAGCTLHLRAEQSPAGHWDRSRIEQIVVNLLANAIKYAPGSEIVVRLYRRDDRAALSIRDHGPGIAADKQASIFERFGRAAPTAIAGLGLGLYIAKQIVTAHNGSLRVESSPGKGAIFIVELPCHADTPPEQSVD